MDSNAESSKQTVENAPTRAVSAHRLTRRRLFTAAAAAVTGVVGVGAVTDDAAGGTVRRAASALEARATKSAVRGPAFDVLTSGNGGRRR